MELVPTIFAIALVVLTIVLSVVGVQMVMVLLELKKTIKKINDALEIADEKTHLHRFGLGQIKIDDYGQMPVEYITGKVEFRHLVFEINSEVLIPRVESEELVNLALDHLFQLTQQKIIMADVGCGSGAIGLSVFLEYPQDNLSLYLSDLSAPALAVAQTNVDRLAPTAPIQLIKSDVLRAYPPQLKFDLITANLPYIPTARLKALDKAVIDYEPILALDGGADGLQVIKKLITQAHGRLTQSGLIILEVDHTHDEEFLRQNLNLEQLQLKIKLDQFQRTRFAMMAKK